ncbi:MAG TPA: DUF748 domain-containing protein [Candidatus Omnitrophota bacterium]|nr:DUF748 domain-containing protein [Candidatus Omnitrophota bacterium]
MPSLLRTILGITAKIIIGVFIFYLFLCLVIIPVGGTWAVKSQATKILKTPVSVRAILFNPFLWRLSVNGFQITDADKRVMAGFNRFSVDVSFLKLFRKEIRVESINLDGLAVNAILQADGTINLMSLVPQAAEPAAAQSGTPEQKEPQAPDTGAAGPQAASAGSKPLPLVIVDIITVQKGTVSFTDQSVSPNFSTSINNIDIRVTGVTTKPDAQVRVDFQARLDEKGEIATEALVEPFVQPLRLETTFSLNNYALQVVTPYAGKYTGRAVGDGKLDVKMTYKIEDNKIKASHKLMIQRFGFGEKIESKDALNLPFNLAIALLEDPQGRIKISLPVSGDMSDPQFKYSHLVFGVVRNFFMKLVTSPFMFMAQMLGADSGTEEPGMTRFVPGTSGLSEEEQEKLKILVNGLLERPKLRIEVNGTYDPVLDWQTMTTEVFNRDFEALMKLPKRTEDMVYQELYQKRFGIMSFWNLTKELRGKYPDLDAATLNAELKKRIIETPPNDRTVFSKLADARAKTVYDFIVACGFTDSSRLSIGRNKETQGSMGFVPIEFTLTVFEKQAPAEEASGTAPEAASQAGTAPEAAPQPEPAPQGT